MLLLLGVPGGAHMHTQITWVVAASHAKAGLPLPLSMPSQGRKGEPRSVSSNAWVPCCSYVVIAARGCHLRMGYAQERCCW